MDKNQCKAVGLNKQRCKRIARGGTEYCLRHRFSRFSEARWWNNTEIQGHICLITLLLAIIAIVFGHSTFKHQDIFGKLYEVEDKTLKIMQPVLTREDAERPLSNEEKSLIAESEKIKNIAKKANITGRYGINVELAYAGAKLRTAKYEEAESTYRTILANEPNSTLTMSGLGITLIELGKYSEAEEILKKALKTEQTKDPNSTKIGIELNNLAELCQIQGKFSEAELFCQQALEISEKQLGKDHSYIAITLNNLANLCKAQNKLAEAEPLYKRALEILEKNIGENHLEAAQIMNNLANLYKVQNRYAEAEPLFRRALEVLEKELGKDHPYVAINLNNLGLLYDAEGKLAEAESTYKRAAEIFETGPVKDRPEAAQILNNLAKLYEAQGKLAEAEPLYKRAVEIAEKSMGPENANTVRIRKNMEICRSKMQGK